MLPNKCITECWAKNDDPMEQEKEQEKEQEVGPDGWGPLKVIDKGRSHRELMQAQEFYNLFFHTGSVLSRTV